MVWIHPKMAKTFSSTTGALVGVGSLKPFGGKAQQICFK
jgi:hypothetical protein